MTAPARITQLDMERATKAVAAAGVSHARIIMDLNRQIIEVIIGAPEAPQATAGADDGWDDDDDE
jgi:hypothetical protein